MNSDHPWFGPGLDQVCTRFGPGLDSVPNKIGRQNTHTKKMACTLEASRGNFSSPRCHIRLVPRQMGGAQDKLRQRITCIGVCEQASAKCVAMDNHVLDAADCLKPQSNQREGGRRQKGGNLLLVGVNPAEQKAKAQHASVGPLSRPKPGLAQDQILT